MDNPEYKNGCTAAWLTKDQEKMTRRSLQQESVAGEQATTGGNDGHQAFMMFRSLSQSRREPAIAARRKRSATASSRPRSCVTFPLRPT